MFSVAPPIDQLLRQICHNVDTEVRAAMTRGEKIDIIIGKIDLSNGYNQILMHPSKRWLFAVHDPAGNHWQPRTLQQGSSVAGAIFSNLIKADFPEDPIIVDNIYIVGANEQKYLLKVERIFKKIIRKTVGNKYIKMPTRIQKLRNSRVNAKCQ